MNQSRPPESDLPRGALTCLMVLALGLLAWAGVYGAYVGICWLVR